MWILTAPFDGNDDQAQTVTKQKLLKPGKTYMLGRKDASLMIRNPKISSKHIEFTVDGYSEENAADPTSKPKLFARNLAKKARTLQRLEYEDTTLNSDTAQELFHGDIVHVVTGIELKVEWITICCYCPPERRTSSISIQACASLGISLVYVPHAAVTHHLTPTFALTAPIALSLVSVATLVKPEWLTTLLSMGDSLETSFVLPSPAKFRPTFTASLPIPLKTFSVWEPNEERAGFFSDRRFIFVGEKGRETQEAIKELVKRGKGQYECFAVDGGKLGLHNVLAKAKAKGKDAILVAEEEAMIAAKGADDWREMEGEAASFDLRFIPSMKIIHAVVYVDVSHIDSGINAIAEPESASSSPLPNIVPNTHPDEPSIPPEPTSEPPNSQPLQKKLVRRAASRAGSRAPSVPPADDKPLVEGAAAVQQTASDPPRRALTRRAGLPKISIFGDDDSILHPSGTAAAVTSGQIVASEPQHTRAPAVSATPARPRLKRRVGTNATTSQFIKIDEEIHLSPTQEPPLKKFKALFEQSDPDKVAQYSVEEYRNTQFQTLDHSETQNESSGATHTKVVGLAAVAEEVEETASHSQNTVHQPPSTQTLKRKTRIHDDDGDVEMLPADSDLPKTKKQAVEDVNAVVPSQLKSSTKPTSKTTSKPGSKTASKPASKSGSKSASLSQISKGGAQPHPSGEPDKDEAFLKAVATKQRGKKVDDTFDREFNNLKISKPELEKSDQRTDWAVLEEFGDDGDLRGNFMVVVEIDVKDSGERMVRRGEGRLEWEGKPDFKKFKKKFAGERRQPIALHLEDEPDFGVGSQYWKGMSQPGVVAQSQGGSSQTMRSQGPSKDKGRAQIAFDSDEDLADAKDKLLTAKGSRPASRKTTPAVEDAPRSTRSSRRSPAPTQALTQGKRKQQPLFLDDDDDDDDVLDVTETIPEEGPDEDEGLKTRSSGRRGNTGRTTRAGSVKPKAPAPILDDDSDDGVAFKGFGTRRR